MIRREPTVPLLNHHLQLQNLSFGRNKNVIDSLSGSHFFETTPRGIGALAFDLRSVVAIERIDKSRLFTRQSLMNLSTGKRIEIAQQDPRKLLGRLRNPLTNQEGALLTSNLSSVVKMRIEHKDLSFCFPLP